MFFVPCDSWKKLFFLKVCRYCDIFTTAISSFSFKQVFWKKSVIYSIGDSVFTNTKFQKSYRIYAYTYFKNFRSWLFLW